MKKTKLLLIFVFALCSRHSFGDITENIFEAIKKNNIILLKTLVTEKNINNKNKWGETPLFEAVNNGFVEIIRLLLNLDADLYVVSQAGLTVFQIAANEDIVRILEMESEKRIRQEAERKRSIKESEETMRKNLILLNLICIIAKNKPPDIRPLRF